MDMNWGKLQEMVRDRRPDMLQSMELQRVRHDWVTGQQQGTMWLGQGKTKIPGSNWVTHHLVIPWNVEGTLRMAQRQHLGTCKSVQTEREWSERDREDRPKNLPYNPIGETVARGGGLGFVWTNLCLIWYIEVVLLGVDALAALSIPWPPPRQPIILSRKPSSDRCPNGF